MRWRRKAWWRKTVNYDLGCLSANETEGDIEYGLTWSERAGNEGVRVIRFAIVIIFIVVVVYVIFMAY